MTRTIADIMATEVVSFSPDTNIHTAIHVLLEKRISGAPVLDDAGALVGVLSKKDCLKIVYSAAYHHDRGGPVSDYMSANVQTLDATMAAKRRNILSPAPIVVSRSCGTAPWSGKSAATIFSKP